jgi:tight adherence protein B
MRERVVVEAVGRRALMFVVPGLVAATFVVLSAAAGAWAADGVGSIDHVETRAGELRLLYSFPGLARDVDPELDSVRVTINDEMVDAAAEPAGGGEPDQAVRRTTIMTIDVSNSMRGERFTEAKAAAKAFLEAAPADVLVGIVAFAGDVRTVQEPTLDREQLSAALDELTLTQETRLHDGVIEAVQAVGQDGQRSLLVLSDGKDTSNTPLQDVTAAISDAAIKVDVVALEQTATARQPLEDMAAAGEGALLTADDPRALVQLFSDEATDLANQVLVKVSVPDDLSGSEGSVAVTIDADGEAFTGTAFVTLKQAEAATPAPLTPQRSAPGGFQVSKDLMWVGLGATGLGSLLVLLIAMGVFTTRKKETLQDRVAAYSRTGEARAAGAVAGRPKPTAPPKTVAGSAIGVTQKALSANKGLESALAAKLDAAGMALRPAEWLLLHAGIAIGAALIGFLLTSGGVVVTLLLLVSGALVPWAYLGLKKSRRLKAFNAQLAETLQLISGGLSAGLSLAQSVDTVVREGTEPVAGEFRRALVEARLGVQLEDALDTVSTRMDSEDFAWVVMAIRIQRDVGGNLAELLLSVAATMREREYLRRQVKSLSAEGRLSGLILAALPPVVLVFLTISNPDYLDPLYGEPLGWLLIAVMAILMAVGSFWMSRLVKVEV